eukprot:PLAT3327.5.p1 GENE.PLAT3327.5~~PLAT3327.5.p1  ORF type:complete len:1805 (+),score=909.40 PLAT3327.5:47-5416(+)
MSAIKHPAERRVFAFDSQERSVLALRNQLRRDVKAHRFCVNRRYRCVYAGMDREGKLSVSQLDEFKALVVEDLYNAVAAEFGEVAAGHDHSAYPESVLQTDYAERQSNRFVARPALMRDLTHVLLGKPLPVVSELHYAAHGDADDGRRSNRLLLLLGTRGTGKTSLLCALSLQLQVTQPQLFCLLHVCGSTLDSIDIRTSLMRICLDLRTRFGLTGYLQSTDYAAVRAFFTTMLARAGEDARQRGEEVLLVFDGIDQMSRVHHPHDMTWLPSPLPAGVRVLISCTPDAACVSKLNARGCVELLMPPLPPTEGACIVSQLLHYYSKRLTEEQIELLLAKEDAARPLFLLICCEELRFHGMYGVAGEGVDDKIRDLPATVPLLFGAVLDRLEREMEQYGKENLVVGVDGIRIVREALCLLDCARHGLLETELLELLRPEGMLQLPHAIWARMYRSLENYLRPHASGHGTLDIFHHQLRLAVRERYFTAPRARVGVHRHLANYFLHKADPQGDGHWDGHYHRAFSDLIFHQLQGQQLQQLRRSLGSLAYIQRQAEDGGRAMEALQADYEAALSYLREEPYLSLKPALLEAESNRQELLRWLHEFAAFVKTQHEVLAARPDMVVSQALAQPDDSAPYLAAQEQLNTLGPMTPHLLLQWRNKPTLKRMLSRFGSFEAQALCLALLPERDIVAVGLADGSILVLKLPGGEQVVALPGKEAVSSIMFSKSGLQMFSSTVDGHVDCWELHSGSRTQHTAAHEQTVCAMTLHCSGRYLATAGMDQRVKVWVVDSGVGEMSALHSSKLSSPALSLAYSPDGRRLVAGHSDGLIEVWDSEGQNLGLITMYSFRAHFMGICSLTFSPDSRTLVTGSLDADVKLWDLSDVGEPGAPLGILQGHTAAVLSLAWSPTARRIVSASLDKSVVVWDADYMEHDLTLTSHSEAVCGVVWMPDGMHVLSASCDRTVRRWHVDISNMPQLLARRAQLRPSEAATTLMLTTVDGISEARARRRSVAPIVDKHVSRRRSLNALLIRNSHALSEAVTALAFSPDGTLLASGRVDGRVALFSTEDCATPLTALTGLSSSVEAIVVSAEPPMLLAASAAGRLLCWSGSPLGAGLALRGVESSVRCLALSSDCSIAAAGCLDGSVRLWDPQRAALLLAGHKLAHDSGATVIDAAFRDAVRLVTLDAAGLLCLWHCTDISSPLIAVDRSHVREPAYSSLALAEQGSQLVVLSDRAMEVLPCWRELADDSTAGDGERKSGEAERAGSGDGEEKKEGSASPLRTSVAKMMRSIVLRSKWKKAIRVTMAERRRKKKLKPPTLAAQPRMLRILKYVDAFRSTTSIRQQATKRFGGDALTTALLAPPRRRSSGHIVSSADAIYNNAAALASIVPEDRELPERAIAAGSSLLVGAMADDVLRVWTRVSAKHVAAFAVSGSLRCWATFSDDKIAVGDSGGRVYLLQLSAVPARKPREATPWSLVRAIAPSGGGSGGGGSGAAAGGKPGGRKRMGGSPLPLLEEGKSESGITELQVALQGDRRAPARLLLLPAYSAVDDTPVEEIVERLALSEHDCMVAVFGGASRLHMMLIPALQALVREGIVTFAGNNNALLMSGGTDSGIMRELGKAAGRSDSRLQLLGVCPAGLAVWPGGPERDGDSCALEQNHTDFVLPDSASWGGETDTMFAIFRHLSKRLPSVAVLCNGGEISKSEAWHVTQAGVPLVVIEGSGRTADAIARLWHEKADGGMDTSVIPDDKLRDIIDSDCVTLFDITNSPSALARQLRRSVRGRRRSRPRSRERAPL